MRYFHVVRKDRSAFPFQFYVDRHGVEHMLEHGGHTSSFGVLPTKDELDFVHVHVRADFVRAGEERWDLPESEWVRVAAAAIEAWLKNETIPEDHFNRMDMILVDQFWYPQAADGSPRMLVDPYEFDVVTDEPWPTDQGILVPVVDDHPALSGAAAPPADGAVKRVVFGFTVDVFPGRLLIGYEQFKRKAAEANLGVQVELARLSDLPPNTFLLLVPAELAEAARQAAPECRIEVVEDSVNSPIFDSIIREIRAENAQASASRLIVMPAERVEE